MEGVKTRGCAESEVEFARGREKRGGFRAGARKVRLISRRGAESGRENARGREKWAEKSAGARIGE